MKFVTQENTCGPPISNKTKTDQNSRSQMYCKLGVLKNFANFTGKHLCWSHFSIKLQARGPAKSSFFTEHPRWLLVKDVIFEVIIIDTIKPAGQCSLEDK